MKFIEEHKEYIDDWLYLMLLRLIHRQGSDMLSSVHFKLQLVLEQIRYVELSTMTGVSNKVLYYNINFPDRISFIK